MIERPPLHPRNCLIFHSCQGRLFYNPVHFSSHPCLPHALPPSTSPCLLCRILVRRSFLFPVTQYIAFSVSRKTRGPSLLFAHTPVLFLLSLFMLLSYFRALYMPVPILLPVPTSSACSPRAATRPRVTWLCGCTCTQWHTSNRQGNGVRMRSTYRVEGTDDSAAYTPQRSALMPCVLAR